MASVLENLFGVLWMEIKVSQDHSTEPPLVDVAAARTATLGVEQVEQVILELIEDADRVEGLRQTVCFLELEPCNLRGATDWERE